VAIKLEVDGIDDGGADGVSPVGDGDVFCIGGSSGGTSFYTTAITPTLPPPPSPPSLPPSLSLPLSVIITISTTAALCKSQDEG
jgi:hypothetical protein